MSSELNYDWLEFYPNGVLQSGRISGEVDWQQRMFDLAAGTQTLRWRYLKDGSASSGQDRGWVGSGQFEPTIEFTASPTSGKLPLSVQFNSPNVDNDGNGIVHWNWDFGDGSTSTPQNPSTPTRITAPSPQRFSRQMATACASRALGRPLQYRQVESGLMISRAVPPKAWTIPDGYAGLTWSNLYVLNGIGFEQSNPSGYAAGSVSVSNVVFNGDGNAASITSGSAFNFISAYLTAGWNDNLQLEVLGYSGSTMTYSNIYTLSATNPTLINFNYFGVDEVYFAPFGGTPHAGYSYSGEQFAMDSVSVSTNSGATIVFAPQSLSVSNGLFQLLLTGPENASVILERSATLTNWTAIATNTLPPGGWPLSLPTGTNARQFYRARFGP